MYIHIRMCISYIPGAGALPDMHARLPEGVHVHFLHSEFLNLPHKICICLNYIVGDTTCDCGFMFYFGHVHPLGIKLGSFTL